MANSSGMLQKWRNYFRTADGDLFEVIDKAILIVAYDRPDEFKMKRARIAEDILKIEEPRITDDILKIKAITDNPKHEPDELVFDSLRRLQQMPLTVEILRETQIGRSVNHLRKHSSMEIRKFARTLVEEWKLVVDAWLYAANADGGVATESVTEEKKELPSLSLDEGGFCAAASSIKSQHYESSSNDSTTPPKDSKTEQKRNQDSVSKKQTPANAKFGASRPKVTNAFKVQQKSETDTIQKKPVPHRQEKFNYDDENLVKVKLEAAKRKLHERYQEIANAKKQRTIRFVEFHDIPKPKNQLMRDDNNRKQWAHRRH